MLTRQVSVVRLVSRTSHFSPQRDSGNFVGADRGLLPTGKENSRRFASQNRLRPLVAGLVN